MIVFIGGRGIPKHDHRVQDKSPAPTRPGFFILSLPQGLFINVDFSLTGKVSHCECEEQGSSPEVNRNNWLIVQWKNAAQRTQG